MDITPPIGIYHRMWARRFTIAPRPFISRCWPRPCGWNRLRASETGARRVWIAIDHCVLDGEEMQRLRASGRRLPRKRQIEDISLSLSHTHGSGWMSRSRADLPGGELIGPYLDRLAGQLADLAISARDTLAPATITFGQGRCSLAAHRDLWDEAAGRFVCGFNPGGPADDTLLVGRITDDAGQVRAVLVNYACHPTTLAWDNRAISPDWVGAMRETVEAAAGGICLFLQGALGDLGPREGFVGDTAVADRNGRQVGYAALAALEALPPAGTRFVYAGPVVSGTWIGTWRNEPLDEASIQRQMTWNWEQHTIDLVYRPELPTIEATEQQRAQFEVQEREAQATGDAARQRDCRAQVEQMTRQLARLKTLPPGKTFPCRVTIGQLGDSLCVLVPGELYQVVSVGAAGAICPAPRDRCHADERLAPGIYSRRLRRSAMASIKISSPPSLPEHWKHCSNRSRDCSAPWSIEIRDAEMAKRRTAAAAVRCPWAQGDENVQYHDEEWGVPVHDDRLLFEFLILEGAQAGLSWTTILKKRENYRQAFDGFDPAIVARYGQRTAASCWPIRGSCGTG